SPAAAPRRWSRPGWWVSPRDREPRCRPRARARARTAERPPNAARRDGRTQRESRLCHPHARIDTIVGTGNAPLGCETGQRTGPRPADPLGEEKDNMTNSVFSRALEGRPRGLRRGFAAATVAALAAGSIIGGAAASAS